MHRLPLGTVALAAILLAACPELPRTVDRDVLVPDDADAFVPLALDRVYETSGEPTGGLRVSLFGQGFTPGAQVAFGDATATGVLVLDEGQINCNVPPHAPGLVDVTVRLHDGQEQTLRDAFLYRGPLALTSVDPTIDRVVGGAEVTVRGDHFDDATRVLIGGRLLEGMKRVDAQTITGRAPARLQGRGGWVEVIATNGFEQRVLDRAFRYVDALEVDWISPAAGSTEGGAVVTLYGAGLEPETVVSIGGVVAETVAPGRGNAITVRAAPGEPGAADIVIDNGQQTLQLSDAFHYGAPQEGELVLGHAWPREVATTGATQVSLAVYGLPAEAPAQGLQVTVGNAPATILQVEASEHLVVVAVPEGAEGPATLTVSRDGQTTSRSDLLTYVTPLTATSVSPQHGPAAGGNEITLTGSGFGAGTEVRFGGALAKEVEVESATRLTVKVPRGVPGKVDVRVTRGGKATTLRGGYGYRDGEPTLLAVAPPVGAQSGGRIVRLHGSGFLLSDAPEVTFGRAAAAGVEVVDDATIRVRAPRGELGAVNVRTDAGGLMAMSYGYYDPTAHYGGTSGGPIPEAINVTVLSAASREPVEEAFVIFWDDIGTPFQGVTDDRGQITFSTEGFGPPAMITAGKDEYTTASTVDFDARDVTLFLIHLRPSSPGGGGGGGGPTPLPQGRVAGQVSGLDKYIVLPPGQCDNKPLGAPGSLCRACNTDADCTGAGARCIALGEQGSRCTTACTTDSDCPGGYSCVGVGFGAVQCVPSPGKRTAWCGTTAPDIFSETAIQPVGTFADELKLFEFTTPPGERAIVCLGGYQEEGQAFVPLMMGVRRHVFAQPGDLVAQQDVKLDIPLTRTLRVRLDDAPLGEGEANVHEVDVFLDLGSDGVFHMPSRGQGVDVNEFELKRFPERFDESLYDATYTLYASARTQAAIDQMSGEGSFVMLTEVTEVDDDTLFEVLPQGAKHTQTGIDVAVHAMHGVPGSSRLWAAADRGRVLTFDGTWWGLLQTPTQVTLRAVWARSDAEVYVAGDQGTLLRWDGSHWEHVSLPRELRANAWWALAGTADDLFLTGEAGVWRLSGAELLPVLPNTEQRDRGVRGLWASPDGSVWMVGQDGLIRRWTAQGLEIMDVPGRTLHAISGAGPDDVWAVGEAGRVAHWDGQRWFDYLPVTRRHLRAVHAAGAGAVWAAGDAGAVTAWDGARWTVRTEIDHVDLFGVRVTGEGRVLTGGVQTLVLTPFLRIPRLLDPAPGASVHPEVLRWTNGGGHDGSYTYMTMAEVSGFPFWTFMVGAGRTEVPLPDLNAAWGLQPIWPGTGWVRFVRIYKPEATLDAFDQTQLNQFQWRSWAVKDFQVMWN